MIKQDAAQVRATINMFAETGRYFQTLAPRRQREAEKLAKHFGDCERIFFTKGEGHES